MSDLFTNLLLLVIVLLYYTAFNVPVTCHHVHSQLTSLRPGATKSSSAICEALEYLRHPCRLGWCGTRPPGDPHTSRAAARRHPGQLRALYIHVWSSAKFTHSWGSSLSSISSQIPHWTCLKLEALPYGKSLAWDVVTASCQLDPVARDLYWRF